MREKQLRLVVTFSTATAAMAMERRCLADGVPGRLIPTPRQLTADCGLAWSAPPEAKAAVLQAAAADGIELAAAYELMI